jgi:hypothetical protein
MTKLTVRKTGRAPKRQLSPTTRSETTSTAKRIVKRAQKGGFKHPKNIQTVDDDDDADNEEDDQEVFKAVKDVSHELFMIKFSCFLGDLCVYEDTNYSCLGEFSYRQFETQSIRKVDKAALEANVEFEWMSGQAVISAKQIRVADNASIIVEDETGWKKVEKGVELAMMENKKSILVKLTVRYKKKGGTSTVISDDEDGDLKKVCVMQCY